MNLLATGRRLRGDGHTPHPGPLPVEGRGGRAERCGLRCSGRAKRRRSPPSPLNGERAGVRGVNSNDLPSGRAAFTLIEVVLAIVIAVGLLLVVLFFYQQAADLRTRVR